MLCSWKIPEIAVSTSLWLQPRYRAIWPKLLSVASPLGLAVWGILLMQLLLSHWMSYEVQCLALHAAGLCSLGILLHASCAIKIPFMQRLKYFHLLMPLLSKLLKGVSKLIDILSFSRLVSSLLLTQCGWLPSVWKITSQTKVIGIFFLMMLSLGNILGPDWHLGMKLVRGCLNSTRYTWCGTEQGPSVWSLSWAGRSQIMSVRGLVCPGSDWFLSLPGLILPSSLLARNFTWALKLKSWLTLMFCKMSSLCPAGINSLSPSSTTCPGRVFCSEQEQQGFVSCCPEWLGAIVFVPSPLLPLKFKSCSEVCITLFISQRCGA